jgi:hypothetical protein
MKTHLTRCAVLLISIIGLLAGCERNDHADTAAPSGSTVSIVSVSPAIGTPLRTGERVKLAVGVSYHLSADSGTLALIVQAADNSAISQNFEVINRGSGQVTLEAEFQVPNTKAIQIFTPLSGQGQSATSTVDSRAFKVVSN